MNQDLGVEQQIFQRASSTFFKAAQLFPLSVREDVFRFYSFVRVADNYVDIVPQNVKAFRDLHRTWKLIAGGKPVSPDENDLHVRISQNLKYVIDTFGCDPSWIDAFFAAMQADVDGKTYETIEDTLEYTYGSAEIVGLMMSRILGLPEAAEPYARLQGRAFQYVNFIRDVAEDNILGRCYFPSEDLVRFGLANLEQVTAERQPADFKAFILFQLARYQKWQSAADKGYSYLPGKARLAVRAAAQSYAKTARKIAADPLSLYTNV